MQVICMLLTTVVNSVNTYHYFTIYRKDISTRVQQDGSRMYHITAMVVHVVSISQKVCNIVYTYVYNVMYVTTFPFF